MKVIEIPNGRLGNGIFRYLAAVLLQIEYGAQRIYNQSECYKTQTVVINDDNYIQLLSSIEKNRDLFENITIMLNGYFQFDIYASAKDKILKFLREHPNDIIYGTDLNRRLIQNRVEELIHSPEDIRKYDIVIHVRLEDFITTNNMIHPKTLITLINDIASAITNTPRTPIAAIVCNKITTDIEKKYIQYIYDHSKLSLFFESNDIITDFHIMKNARILVCSLSTLSWCAALLSENVQKVYVPKNRTGGHQTFLQPIENTIIYDNIFCDKNDLEKLFYEEAALETSDEKKMVMNVLSTLL